MKKLVIALFLFVNVCCQIFASPADTTPYKVIQPNGDTIWISIHGDEYVSWYEDYNGNVIFQNNEGYWVYVTIENDDFTLTNQIVTNTSIPIGVNKSLIFNHINQTIEKSYIKINQLDSSSIDYRSNNSVGKYAPLPANGSQKILTILVQFNDVKFQDQNGIKQKIESVMNQNNSVKNYYLEASYNKLNISSIVVGPYTVSNNSEYYGAATATASDAHPQELAEEAIELALRDINTNINLNQFDNNNDGWVECVHIIYAGKAQNLHDGGPNDIWPHQSYLTKIISKNGISTSQYMMTQEVKPNEHQIGIICHELAHILGAPDFYDVKKNHDNDTAFCGTGKWDLMASGDKNNIRYNPAHPNPYIKTEIFKWATLKELSGTNILDTLRPSELDSNSIYKLSTSTEGEYYLLENRQDMYLPGSGLVIYHVKAGIDTVNRKKINIEHPQYIYVVDANNHIAKPTGSVTSYGDIDSLNATFRSTHSQNMYFTSESSPSNCAWNNMPTQNKNVCFISEEMIDGEQCILFVLNPEIDGPDILCDSAIYSLKHVPSNATIEWTYTRPSGLLATTVPLTTGSGQGTKAVCFKRGSYLSNEETDTPVINPENPFLPAPTSTRAYVQKPYSGFIEIQANVTLNGETNTWRKTIYMPEKVEMNTLSNNWFAGATKTITLKTPTDTEVINDIAWNVELPGEFPYSVAGSSSITVTPRNGGTAKITATYIKGCNDEYMSHIKTYTVIKFPNLTYSNPASGSVEISVVNGDTQDESGMRTMSMNNQSTPYMGAYRLELWHDIYGKVREMDVPENTPTVTMNLEGLNSGVYVLRLIIDNQVVEASQLIVK